MHVTLAVEGRTDEAVARRLIREAKLDVGNVYGLRGKPGLDAKLGGYNQAARHSPWLVLRDLNSDADCAPRLRARLLPDPAPKMRLHIVVRAVEAWLIADAVSLAEFLSVSSARIPARPEELENPKATMVQIARHSRRGAVRDAILPRQDGSAPVGPGYVATLTEFAIRRWRPGAAAHQSESLARLRKHLRALQR